MDELIKQVSTKAGITPDQAKTAVSTVIDYLKSRLPGPVAGQLDAIVGGNSGSGMADAARNVGGLFGK